MTDSSSAFRGGKGKRVAVLDNPTKEQVQTITLPKNTKAQSVTLMIERKTANLKFREVEIYSGPLQGNRFKLVISETVAKNTSKYVIHIRV